MINGLYEAHLPVRNLKQSIAFYEGLGLTLDHIVDDRLAFLWIVKEESWLGLWVADQVELDYHPSIRHIAFHVELEALTDAVDWLTARGYTPRKAFGFEPTEPFVMALAHHAHAKIHFNDPDGNSLEFICPVDNPHRITGTMYWSDWLYMNAQAEEETDETSNHL
ncbi:MULTISPECIES: VOC family protein [unclassified Exiguobacterium]|uniref:VOC family protein n=1 Tax=unclassified Exiguobacterium TaxID=2644629 RepID=UPI000B58F7C2|nr:MULTISPECIES: VOC family protein [unclassified Exiguobacterium]ASI35416.1 glutathione transferase [Exiguobacterium sp. N4-1P]ASI37429.1 glutathione transferase [Exiguobacterium sp. N4-1P]